MGKAGASSWLTAVKRAFRSPTRESDKRSSRRREETEQEEEEEEKVRTISISNPNLQLLFLEFLQSVYSVLTENQMGLM